MSGERGMSLLEVTIAVALFAALTGSLFGLMHPAQDAFAPASDAADLEQRVRIAVDALSRDLTAAGAGSYSGGLTGPLLNYFAPVQPIRTGTADDALSIVFVRSTPVQTTLSSELPPSGDVLRVASDPGCPLDDPLCGISKDMRLLIYDDAGRFDMFAVVDVADDHARVKVTSRAAGDMHPTYRVGAKVVEAEMRTYGREMSGSPPREQLLRNGASLVEHVVGFTLEYLGKADPPVMMPAGPSYGPAPPAFPIQTTAYPEGENCTFQVDPSGPSHVPRLEQLGPPGTLVPFTADQFADGPWCPDETDSNRWDADLLRIRLVGVTVRLQAALPWLRRSVPVQRIHFAVTPRNMIGR